MSIVNALLSFAVLGVVVLLGLYVTHLFAQRLRQKQPPLRSFLMWLRDLFDVASGLG